MYNVLAANSIHPIYVNRQILRVSFGYLRDPTPERPISPGFAFQDSPASTYRDLPAHSNQKGLELRRPGEVRGFGKLEAFRAQELRAFWWMEASRSKQVKNLGDGDVFSWCCFFDPIESYRRLELLNLIAG